MGLYLFNGSKNATIDKSPHSMRALSFIIYRCKGGVIGIIGLIGVVKGNAPSASLVTPN